MAWSTRWRNKGNSALPYIMRENAFQLVHFSLNHAVVLGKGESRHDCCFVKFNRKPASATVKLVLASGPKPSTTERRHPRYAEGEEGKERRRGVIRLHVDGWNAKSSAGYLDVSRKTVH